MAVKSLYAHAGFLSYLMQAGEATAVAGAAPLTPALTQLLYGEGEKAELSQAGKDLIPVLTAQMATHQAAYDTALVADDLRRYQKFAKPGQPSPHIVVLRKQQAAVRQASSLAKQSFIKGAAAFVRTAGIAVPEKVGLELYMIRWITINVPKDVVA